MFRYQEYIVWGQSFRKGLMKYDKEVQNHLKVIKLATKQFLRKRIQEIEKNNDGDKQKNILSKLVYNSYFRNSTSQEEKEKKIEDITGDVLIFFFAGTDTTSDVLTVTLHMLNKYPQIRQKLLDQLKQFNGVCDSNTIKKMKYMDSVFNQSLRMYGPANWTFLRETFERNKNTICDVPIPNGTYIGIQSMTIHHNEKYYQTPYQYRPQRWLTYKKENPFTFISFGGGQRNCIGQHLSRIQFKIILCQFLKNYNFSTSDQFQMHLPFPYESKNNKFKLIKIQQSQLKQKQQKIQ